MALRGLAGLLTIFLAFLLKGDGAAPVVVAAPCSAPRSAGSCSAPRLASRLPERVTARLTLASLVVPASAAWPPPCSAARSPAALAAGLSGVSYSLCKFALDAALQTHVPGGSTSGAFARSETALQLAWALGGGVAVALPTVRPWASAWPRRSRSGPGRGRRAAAGRPSCRPLRSTGAGPGRRPPPPSGSDPPPHRGAPPPASATGRPRPARLPRPDVRRAPLVAGRPGLTRRCGTCGPADLARRA